MSAARIPRDAGFSLIEVLVTVVIVGITFVVFIGGMGTAIIGADHQRKITVTQTGIRNFAEAIKAANYQDCAVPATYASAFSPTPPDRLAASTSYDSTTNHAAPSVTPSQRGAVLYFYGVGAGTTMSLPTGTGPGWTVASTNVDTTKQVTASFDDELWTTTADTPRRVSNSTAPASSVTETVMLSTSASVARRPVSSNTSTGTSSLSLTPSGIVSGDEMIAQVVVRMPTTVTEPPGWVLIVDKANSSVRSLVYQRTATASETSPYTWAFSSPVDAAGGLTAYVGTATGFTGAITSVTYWNGTAFVSSCPSPDAGMQKVSLSLISNDKAGTATVDVIKRRP